MENTVVMLRIGAPAEPIGERKRNSGDHYMSRVIHRAGKADKQWQ